MQCRLTRGAGVGSGTQARQGWMYRAGLESIVGFNLRGTKLNIDPCIPRWWRDYEINYRRGSTVYRIKVENPLGISHGVARTELDGVVQAGGKISLLDDGQVHTVRVVLGEPAIHDAEHVAAAIPESKTS